MRRTRCLREEVVARRGEQCRHPFPSVRTPTDTGVLAAVRRMRGLGNFAEIGRSWTNWPGVVKPGATSVRIGAHSAEAGRFVCITGRPAAGEAMEQERRVAGTIMQPE